MSTATDQNLLERLLDLSRRMSEMRQLPPLLNYVMDEAIRLVGAERGVLVLLKRDGTFDFQVSRGGTQNQNSENAEDLVSMSVLKQVIETGKPLILKDALDDPNWNKHKSVYSLQLRSVMCVPFVSRGETIGAIYVENRTIKGRFQENDLAPLTFFAHQAAVSIENAMLNDDLEQRVAARTQELERAKEQIEQSWLEAVEANRMRTMLLGNVAHDLRSPLSIVIEALGLLQDGIFGPLAEEQSEWIGKSLEAANYVLNLTNDVFDLTKLEMGGMVLYWQESNLHEFLMKTYNVGLGLRRPEEVEFRISLPPELPTISMDSNRINQVLLNLISNAFKFTTKGSVTLYAEQVAGQDEVLIGVRDTGDGIPADELEHLFQRFQQVDKNQARRRMGTGLGLAISRELIESHNGRIWVESTLGTGSDFKFALPLKTPEKLREREKI
jgi:signal transduction histidine kinase